MKRVDRCGRCFVLTKPPLERGNPMEIEKFLTSVGGKQKWTSCSQISPVGQLHVCLHFFYTVDISLSHGRSKGFRVESCRSFQWISRIIFIKLQLDVIIENFSVLIGRRIWANGAGRGVAPACPFCVSNDGGRLLGNGCFDQCWLRWPIQSICPLNFRDCAIDSFPPKKLKATDPSLAFHCKSLPINIQISLCSFKKFSIFFLLKIFFKKISYQRKACDWSVN